MEQQSRFLELLFANIHVNINVNAISAIRCGGPYPKPVDSINLDFPASVEILRMDGKTIQRIFCKNKEIALKVYNQINEAIASGAEYCYIEDYLLDPDHYDAIKSSSE